MYEYPHNIYLNLDEKDNNQKRNSIPNKRLEEDDDFEQNSTISKEEKNKIPQNWWKDDSHERNPSSIKKRGKK